MFEFNSHLNVLHVCVNLYPSDVDEDIFTSITTRKCCWKRNFLHSCVEIHKNFKMCCFSNVLLPLFCSYDFVKFLSFTAKMMELSKYVDFNGFNKDQNSFAYNSCPSIETSHSFVLCLSLKVSLK